MTVTNTSSAPVDITGVAISGEFAQTNTCPGSLAPGASCAVSVKFTPTTEGAETGTITISYNGTGSPQSVSLAGTGAATPVVYSLNFLQTLDFGSQPVGTPSVQAVTLANATNQSLPAPRIIVVPASAFTETNDCGTTLAAGASCTIYVTFTPRSTGESRGILIVVHTGKPHPVEVNRLVGEGTS